MIERIFKEDMLAASAIVNERNVTINFKSRLSSDQNIQSYLSTVLEKSVKYDELNHRDKYKFKQNTESAIKVLRSFKRLLLNVDFMKSKTAEEILKPCDVFPDYGGETVITLLSSLPVIELIHEKIVHEKLLYETSDVEGMIEYQNERVLGSRVRIPVRADDDKLFVNHSLKKSFADIKSEQFNTERKSVITEGLKEFERIHLEHGRDKAQILIGSIYWDDISKKKREFEGSFTDILSSLVGSITSKKAEALSRLNHSLCLLLSDMISIKGLSSSMSEDGLLELRANRELTQEEIREVSCLSYVREYCELIGLRLKSSSFDEGEYKYVFDSDLYLCTIGL
ncbi:hypothetical protein VCHA53O466_50215 [Vibrio chagasii]|nr:hypothetical protein VCHA53O466_50215 [Vibrio chagasii]